MIIFKKNKDVQGEEGSENSDTCGQGGKGVKNGQKFADSFMDGP